MKRIFAIILLAILSSAVFAQEIDCSKLTKRNHPRLFFTEEGFRDLKAQIKAGENKYLVQLHENMMANADKEGLSDVDLVFDGKGTFNNTARKFSYRIISAAYAYRLTGDRNYLSHAEHTINCFADRFREWTTGYWLENSELCLSLALAYDWLYKDLSKAMRKKIVAAIADIGYSDAADEQKAWFYRAAHNWNHVCNATLVCAAIATYEEHPEPSKAVIMKALETNPIGMKGVYAPDGVSPESPSYWDYATNYEAIMLMALEDNFGTDFGLSASEGFAKAGEYRLFCVAPSGRWFNYGDCNGGSAKATTTLWYYAWKFGNRDLLYYTVQELDKRIGTRALFMAIACSQRIGYFETKAPEKLLFTGSGLANVIIARSGWGSEDAYLGFKGGVGKANHSHLDEGSFVYEADGVRWADEFQHPSYDLYRKAKSALKKEKKGFQWYEKFIYGNPRHSTLTINGKYMADRAEAAIVESFDTPERRGGTLDLSAMLAGELASARRTAALVDEHDLEVTDVLKALPEKPATVRWTLVTPASAEITPDGIILSKDGKKMMLKADCPVIYQNWSADPKDYSDSPVRRFEHRSADKCNLCGFTFELGAGEEIRLVTTLKRL